MSDNNIHTIIKPECGYIIVDGIECPFSVVDGVACMDFAGSMLEAEHLISLSNRLKEITKQWDGHYELGETK